MKLPNRNKNHISESESLRILKSAIPEHWILREVTERDYGIDCYIELVNVNNQLTGDIVSVQVKSKDKIEWDNQNIPNTKLYNVKIETTNYWNGSVIPVILCLVDVSKEEVYIVPVKEFIRQSYSEYIKQDKFSYTFRKDYKLTRHPDDYMKLIVFYFLEKNRVYFETNMLIFFASIKRDREFINMNTGRDYFMGIELEREVELRALIVQIRDLCHYLYIDWDLKPYEEYQLESQLEFGRAYSIYEKHMTMILEKLDKKIDVVYKKCKHLVLKIEQQYWIESDNTLYNYLCNI